MISTVCTAVCCRVLACVFACLCARLRKHGLFFGFSIIYLWQLPVNVFPRLDLSSILFAVSRVPDCFAVIQVKALLLYMLKCTVDGHKTLQVHE